MEREKPDLLLVDEFIPEHAELYERLLHSVEWDTRMASRHTASFGEPYNYSQMSYPAVAMHPDLEPVIDALDDKLGIRFNNCLLNLYLSGDSTMGFHADDTSDLLEGTGVAIISLGSTREITYRHQSDHDNRHIWPLLPGSLLYMDSMVQEHWKHAIRKQPGAGLRISLTWRAFATTPASSFLP